MLMFLQWVLVTMEQPRQGLGNEFAHLALEGLTLDCKPKSFVYYFNGKEHVHSVEGEIAQKKAFLLKCVHHQMSVQICL